MPDFTVRSDSVNVEQIMEQIRARIREKRGVDYTEQQIRDLAAVKLEKVLDPRGLRSDLLEQFKRRQPCSEPAVVPTMFETHRRLLRLIRKLLSPILKLFFNPNALVHALHREVAREKQRRDLDALYFEVIHNLVFEMTRIGIEVKNLKMRVESLASRLEFNERRARALESVVAYRPSSEEQIEVAVAPGGAKAGEAGGSGQPSAAPGQRPGGPEGPGQRSRRRRRRGRRSGASAVSTMSGSSQPSARALDDAAAREVASVHGETAESVEQPLAAEAQASEPQASAGQIPPPGPSTGVDQGEPDDRQ